MSYKHFPLILLFFYLYPIGHAYESVSAEVAVPELYRLNLPHLEIIKYSDPRLSNLYYEEDQYFLVVKLGQLTKKQFREIHHLYGDLSQVSYDPDKEYELRDFLPPSMQAVLNKTFTPIHYEESFIHTFENESLFEELSQAEQSGQGTPAQNQAAMTIFSLRKNAISSSTNCWGTTIENLNSILSASTQYNLYLPSRWEADDIFRSNSLEISVNELQNWDVLAIKEENPGSGQIMLQHTGIIIGENLVFEKTDSSENDPYRLSLRSDVIKKYEGVFEEGLILEYYRLPSFSPILENKNGSFESFNEYLVNFFLNTNFDLTRISQGCETSLGGGCDLYHQYILPMQIGIDPLSGHGILYGDPDTLNRFVDLERN